ncbi:unnamed protein product, partial [Prorocentrum cordatum]
SLTTCCRTERQSRAPSPTCCETTPSPGTPRGCTPTRRSPACSGCTTRSSSAPLSRMVPFQDERRVIISQVPAASECPWQLGVEVTMEAPVLITQVLFILRENGYEWSQLTPWRVRARPLTRGEGQLGIVLTIQVYKLASGRYLIDTLVSQGPTLPALHAALHLLRCIAESDLIAPHIVDRSGGGLLAGRARGRAEAAAAT